MKLEVIGSYAFIAGVLIAVIASVVTLDKTMVTSALVVLGLIVGLINVTEKETQPFLVAAVSMVIVAYMTRTGIETVPLIGEILKSTLNGIMTFVSPAVLIVALKQIYSMAKDA